MNKNNYFTQKVSTADGMFKITLDVKNFDPEDIKVKTVGDVVEIQGRHEEKKDETGVVKRDFTRKYNIPTSKCLLNKNTPVPF